MMQGDLWWILSLNSSMKTAKVLSTSIIVTGGFAAAPTIPRTG
jgi:hypothetical protein